MGIWILYKKQRNSVSCAFKSNIYKDGGSFYKKKMVLYFVLL